MGTETMRTASGAGARPSANMSGTVHVDHDFWSLPTRPRRWSAASTSTSTTSRSSKTTTLRSVPRTRSSTTTFGPPAPVDRVPTLCDGQSVHKGKTETAHDSYTNAGEHSRRGSGQHTDSSGQATPSIIVTQPSIVTIPSQAAITTDDSNMSRRNRVISGDSHSASLRLVLSPKDYDYGRVPFPLTVPTPTRSRHDSYSSLRQPPTPTPASSRYAPARSSSINYYEPPSMTEAGRSHFMSFHTDSTGQFIEIPRFKKRELNLAIVRCRAARVWWALLWAICVSYGLLSLFFDVNVLYIIVQVAMYPPHQTNARQLWIFTGTGYALCWAISVLGVWLSWEVCYKFWRTWNRRYPAIEPIYFSLAASTHLSLVSFDHFVFLLHTRLSPLGTSHASDIVPETAYALVQLLPGLLPLAVRVGIAGVVLLSFWGPEALVPSGTSVAAIHRDPNFFSSRYIGELSTYSKYVLLAFVCWVGARIVVVLISAVLLWWYSFRPFGRLRSWTPQAPSRSESQTLAHDPADWNTPAKGWRDENQFQWAWRERTRARIQNAFELCMVRPRHMSVSEKMPDLIEPATPGYQEVLQSPNMSMRTPTSVSQTPTSMVRTPNSHTHLMRNAAATTPTPDKVTFRNARNAAKESLDLPRYPAINVGSHHTNGQLSSSAMYHEVVVEDTLYCLSEETESQCPTGRTADFRWPTSARSLGTVLSDSSAAQYRFEKAEPGPLSASFLPSPEDPLPATPTMSAGPTDERFKSGILTRVPVDPLAGVDLNFEGTPEPVKKALLGLPPMRAPPPRSARGRHESSSPANASFHEREASGASGLSGMSESTASVSVSKFLNYTGTPPPPPLPPRPRVDQSTIEEEDPDQTLSQEGYEYDQCSHVSGHTNDDLISLQQFVERDTAVPAEQFLGSPEFIRFQAHSRRADNTFEHGTDGYGYGDDRSNGEYGWNRSPPAFPTSLIRVSGVANAGHLDAPSAFPRLPPLPGSSPTVNGSTRTTPVSSLGSRVPPSTSSRAGTASSRATAGNLSSRIHGSTRGGTAAGSVSSRGGARSTVSSRGAASSASSRAAPSMSSRRGARPPNIILPPNQNHGIDLATPNEFGQMTPPRPARPSSVHVGLVLVPSPASVLSNLPVESASKYRSRQSTKPTADPGYTPTQARRHRTRSVLGFEFEMVRADASGHAVAIESGSESTRSARSREASGFTLDTDAASMGREPSGGTFDSDEPEALVAVRTAVRPAGVPVHSSEAQARPQDKALALPPTVPPRPRRVPVPTSPYVLDASEGLLDRLRRMSSA